MRIETIAFCAELPTEGNIDMIERIQDEVSDAFNKWAKEMNITPTEYVSSETIVTNETLTLRVIYMAKYK